MDLNHYQRASADYEHLSLRDLLDAREQHHVHLMLHPNVVATALGRYRIRKKDSWPTQRGPGKVHGKGVRTLENSEVRPYSWPAVLVFVEQWMDRAELEKYPDAVVPKTVFLPDGRRVPVCVIEAPKESRTAIEARDIRFPINRIGGGSPVVASVQGREYAATVACLVSDGHKVYGLTNRHVVGDEGEVIYSKINGNLERIGVSSAKQLTRAAFSTIYPGWPGRDVYVNLDVGLIELDNLDSWTAEVRELGELGKMVDVSVNNISLGLIGCRVRGEGAASGTMLGEIHALFYRYKTNAGFEYVADVLIGPETSPTGRRNAAATPFATHPGDSGTLWVLVPSDSADGDTRTRKSGLADDARASKKDDDDAPQYLPLAMQWGRNMLYSAGIAPAQPYVLATFLSRVCAEIGVDPVRNWNVEQTDTWGALGHFSIAARTLVALSKRSKRLVSLMTNNLGIISHDDATLLKGDFVGMGKAAFVPMADVPDFYWKPRLSMQGFARQFEGPNHFADMDQPDAQGNTLLKLCKKEANIDPDKWNDFYSSVRDLLDGKPIEAKHRGLLPFRVWQIFDALVEFAHKGDGARFVCAAGVLTHYIGDACQPLHISYLHDGDPLRAFDYVFKKGEHAGETERRPLGQGVHSAYEDEMIFAHRVDILKGLKATPKTTQAELVGNGFEAAKRTIEMMRKTFHDVAPVKIVNRFIAYDGINKNDDRANYMWKKFGDPTIGVMQGGTHLLAVLWESAWVQGDGEKKVKSVAKLTQKAAMKICQDPNFLPSLPVSKIGAVLKK